MISIKLYKKICFLSEDILKNHKENILIQSINELHVVRPHPIFLKQYLILGKSFFSVRISILFIKNFLSLFFNLIKSIFVKSKSNFKEKKIKFLFVSHLLDENQVYDKTKKDFYFSHLIEHLNKKNFCISYINHTKKNFKNAPNKIYLDNNIGFTNELNVFFSLIKNSLKLFFKALNEKNSFKKKFFLFLFSNCISNKTAQNYRIYYQTLKQIYKLKPKLIITTFEGHAFERNIFKAVSDSNLNSLKLAFHHSLPFKNQFSYTSVLHNGSDPNYILASGKNSYKKFSKIKEYRNKVYLVGSNRISEKKRFKIKKMNRKIIHNCLVMAEGIEEENEILLNFCKLYLKKFNNLNFLIRLHPLLTHKKEFYKSYFKDFPNKVHFSNNKNPKDDFKKCSIALYRGTSLIFDAIRFGIIPFYLRMKGEIDFDPLSMEEKENNGNQKITSVSELKIKLSDKKIFRKRFYSKSYSLPNKTLIKKLVC